MKIVRSSRKQRGKRAVTLTEMLIVVAILAMLSSIAFMNIQRHRRKAQQYICISHLRTLENNISLWAINNAASADIVVQMGDLIPGYLRSTPYCPLDSSMEGYTLTTAAQRPVCTQDPTTHILD